MVKPRVAPKAARRDAPPLECSGDTLAARMADDGSRIPHEVALAIMDGERPVAAYRRYRRLTLRQLAARTGLAVGYLSEIERGLKPGSTSALSRIADAVGTTIDTLVRLD